jgi:hypothetical protein
MPSDSETDRTFAARREHVNLERPIRMTVHVAGPNTQKAVNPRSQRALCCRDHGRQPRSNR